MKKMFNKMSKTVKTMTCKAHCAVPTCPPLSATLAARATSTPPSRS